MAAVEIPIACTLDAAAARSQLDEWRALFARMVVGTDRPERGHLRLHLGRDLDGLGHLVTLAQREKDCCRFFDFAIEIDTDAATLVVRVPDEAAAILDQFAALVRA
jgi:hypothetical protein